MYGIKEGYKINPNPQAFDDTPFRDEFQREVYELAQTCPQRTVVDVGCGSGYKLLKYFSERRTIGVEVEPTLSWLRKTYQQRAWVPAGKKLNEPGCLVICADVIEHVMDPDALLDYICSLRPACVVMSTPDRVALRLGTEDGPPKNVCHVREWMFEEFISYLSERFNITSSVAGKTIIVVAEPLGVYNAR